MSRAQKQHFNQNAYRAKKLGQELALELGSPNPYVAGFWGWKVDVEKCLRLIAAGADVTTGMGGMTPLMSAAHYGHVELVKALLKAGAPVNAIGEPRATALSCALVGGGGNRYDIAVLLVNAGADPRIVDRGNSPLSRACQQDDDLRFLLETAADYKAKNKKPGKLGIQGAARGRHLVKLMTGNSNLFTSERLKKICALLDDKTDFSQKYSSSEETPLICAISWCHADYALEILRLAPQTVNIRDKWERNALHHCAQMSIKNKLKVIEQLLAAGADAAIHDHMKQSALDIATQVHVPCEIYDLLQKAVTTQIEKLSLRVGKFGIYSSRAVTPLPRLHIRKPRT
jgi:ankyrin repeat protein